jgi:ABC-type branched-subunit amino acid transport system substrate-binding protein
MRTTILAALAAAAVLTTTACGTAGAVGSTTLGGAASLAPSDAVAFVAIDTNLSSGQWASVDGLLAKFPSAATLTTQLQQGVEKKTKLNWETDIKPALGDELDVVALPGAKKELVGLTQSHDQAKLDALLKKEGLVSQQIGGWTAFAETQAALDKVASAADKLSGASMYNTATAKLATDALVHAYANGTEAQKLVDALKADKAQPETVPFQWASADVSATDSGLRVSGYTRDGLMANTPAQQPTQPYASHLVDEIPAGALAVADVFVTPGDVQLAGPHLLKPLKDLLGNDPALISRLDQILGGETALYARQGLIIPEITLVTQPADTQAATSALSDLLKTLKAKGTLSGPLAMVDIVHEVIGGQLVVSTSQKGLADFRAAGDKLSGDSSFKDAQKASEMPGATTGFLYVNAKDAVPMVQAFGPLLGLRLPPALRGDLSALRTVTAYGTRAGAQQSFRLFLQVR